jgi:hypothetical protein
MSAQAEAARGARRRRAASPGGRLRAASLAALAIAVGLAAWWQAPRGASASDLSASEIVARNVAARGGLDAWRKVQTMVWLGHIEGAHAPMPSLPFKLEQKRPNKTRLEIQVPGDRSVRAFDGVRGWKVRSTRGRPEVEPYSPQEARYAQAGHGLDGPLIDSSARSDAVSLQGVDEIGGRRAYHLSVRLKSGGAEDVWVDAETFLEVRYDRMADGPAGASRRVSATYGDYRVVDGLRIPFLITTGGGPGTSSSDRMQLETVVLNAPLEDSTFASHGAPSPGGRMRPGFAARAPAQGGPSSAAAAEERGAGQR